MKVSIKTEIIRWQKSRPIGEMLENFVRLKNINVVAIEISGIKPCHHNNVTNAYH